jgi:hypothetical protein
MQDKHKLDEAFVVKGKGGKKKHLQAGALFDRPRCVFVPAPMTLMMFSKWDTGLDDWQAEAAFKSPDYLAKGLVQGMRSLPEDDPAAFEEHKGLAGEVIALLWAVWSPTTGRKGQPPLCLGLRYQLENVKCGRGTRCGLAHIRPRDIRRADHEVTAHLRLLYAQPPQPAARANQLGPGRE